MSGFSIATVRNRVILYCSTWANVLPHVFSTIVFLELWSKKDEFAKASDLKKFKRLEELFSKIRQSIRRGSPNIETLALNIYTQFIAPLSLNELKEIIGESAACKFPDKASEGMVFSSVSANPPVLKHNYLNLPNLLSPAPPQAAAQISEPEDVPLPEPEVTPAPSPAPQAVGPTNAPACSTLIQVKRELEHLYDRLVENRGGTSFTKPNYIWEWSFNIDEYHDITNAALKCNNLATNQDKEALLRYNKCVFIIVAYVAERYKREWNGNDSTDNALIQIGYDGSYFSEEIAHKYFEGRSGIMIFRHDNEAGTHEYLESLRMEGGLPVMRINGNTDLADFAEYLYDETDRAIDILSERVNNKCMRYSYKEKLSIYQYTMELLKSNGIRTIYGSDVDTVEDIKTFADILTNGRAKAERKKTRLLFQAWHDIENNSPISLTPILHMYPEDNGDRHYAISPSRLISWGIKDAGAINSFTLDFVDTDNQQITIYDEDYCEMDSILFSKCYNGDFVEFNSRKRFFFPTIPEEKLSMENIHLGNYSCRLSADIGFETESTSILPERKDIKDYIQLYSNDNKFWISNKGADPYKYSALIARISKNCHPTDDNYENLSNGLAWIPFTTHVKLSIRGRNRIIYNAQGNIYAFPKAECTHPICQSPYAKNLGTGLVEFYGNPEEVTQSLYLVKSS